MAFYFYTIIRTLSIRYNYSVCNSCSLRGFSINHMFYVRFRNIWHNAIAQQQDYTSAHEAPLLASTLAASVFNVANFLGAMIGSILLSIGLPYIQITFISGGIIILGIILNFVNHLYERKHITFSN